VPARTRQREPGTKTRAPDHLPDGNRISPNDIVRLVLFWNSVLVAPPVLLVQSVAIQLIAGEKGFTPIAGRAIMIGIGD
jgi:hypothetical protein